VAHSNPLDGGWRGKRMDDREFQEAVKKLNEDTARIIDFIERMPPMTKEQESTVAEILFRRKDEYDRYIKGRFETKTQSTRIKDAWNAARQAAQEGGSDYAPQSKSWRAMWLALALVGALLLLMKALYR
jgi:hypothetical protein